MSVSAIHATTASEVRVRVPSPVLATNASVLRVGSPSSIYSVNAEAVIIGVSLATVQANDAALAAFDEVRFAAKLSRIESSLPTRVIWDDLVAELIRIGNDDGNAELRLLAGASQDLRLGARGGEILLNDAGNTTPTSGSSLVGAINAALAAPSPSSGIILPFGGNFSATGQYANANGDPTNAASGSYGVGQQISAPADGTITAVGQQVTTTGATMRVLINDGAAGSASFTANNSVATMSLAVTAGQSVSIDFQSGTAPGISNFQVKLDI